MLRSTVSLFILVFLAPNSEAADEIHWLFVGPTAVTLDWRGPEDTVEYGLDLSYGNAAAAVTPSPLPWSSPGPFWEAKLTDLRPGTLYHYRVGTGSDHTFRSPPSKGTSGFVVLAEGDIGDSTSYANMAPIQAQIAQAVPAFTLIVGDLTYAGSHGQAACDQHFNDVMIWSQDAAYWPAWGNTDWDHTTDDLRNYKGRVDFPNPQTSPGSPAISCCGEDWSWFDYGNVRFISYPEPWTGAWENWNANATTLMDSAQADATIRWIVTFGHRPAYSSGHHPGEVALKGYMDTLACNHSKYVLNINAHSHDYERTYPQKGSSCSTGAPGVVHVTAGSGGGGLAADGSCLWAAPCGGSCPCPPPAYSAFRAMRQGPVRFTFHTNGIEEAFICGPPGGGTNDIACTKGDVVDTHVIGDLVSAGEVPTTMTESKVAGGEITMAWDLSCVSSDTDYEILEGALVAPFDSHHAIFCSTGGATTKTFTTGNGDTYYLVVPANLTREGSYGRSSDGRERSVGLPECLPQQIGQCP